MTGETQTHDLSRTLGLVRVIEMDPLGRARLEYHAGAHMCHSGGVVQGGFLIAMMDDAMGFNCFISLGMANRQASIDIHTHFLRAVQYGRVEVEARVVRAGRSVAFLEAELFGPDGELAARATSSMKLNPIAKVAEAAE